VQPDLDAAELFEFKRDMLRENVLQQLIGLFLFLRQFLLTFEKTFLRLDPIGNTEPTLH